MGHVGKRSPGVERTQNTGNAISCYNFLSVGLADPIRITYPFGGLRTHPLPARPRHFKGLSPFYILMLKAHLPTHYPLEEKPPPNHSQMPGFPGT